MLKEEVCCRTFFKEINSDSTFLVQKNLNIPLLIAAPGYFSLPVSLCIPSSFIRRRKPILCPFVNIFLTKTCFSIHIIHFTLFALSNTKRLLLESCVSLECFVGFVLIILGEMR